MKGVSQIIAALGLIAIATVVALIGYVIVTNYVHQSFRPNYNIAVSYAKLVYITSNEPFNNETYMTLKGEIGISNPSKPIDVKICIVSAKKDPSAYTFSVTTISGSCASVHVDSGYNVYSFIIRINTKELDTICSNGTLINCPVDYDWHIVVLDSNNVPIAIVKPIYVVP